MKYFRAILSAVILLVMGSGCSISLKGVSIPPDVHTFFIDNFVLTAVEAPADLNQRFGEALRNKIRNESRLKLQENEPDIIFSGNIRQYRVTPEAITAGTTAALNKLEIVIDVTLEYADGKGVGYKNKPFTFFRTFDSSQDFQNIQDTLIREIFDLFTEQIFNDAFSQW